MTRSDDTEPAIPPYDGRKTEATPGDETYRDGARTGGATGPVNDPDMKAPDPDETPRGAVASPVDEQPAEQEPDGESPEASTGPAHTPGTSRGEDQR